MENTVIKNTIIKNKKIEIVENKKIEIVENKNIEIIKNKKPPRKIAPSRLARQEVHMCYMINQKRESCSWRALSNDKLYCKRHSIYEDVYTKDDIINLQFCSGCKNPFKKIDDEDDNYKICIKCRGRSEKIRIENKKDIIKCIGFTKQGTLCPYQAKENSVVCDNHITWKKYKDTIDSGQNMCKNWERGCFEIISLDKKYCINCRIAEQTKENKLNKIKREKAIEYNNNNNNNKMCKDCNKIVDSNNLKNKKCLDCYETYNICQQHRNPKDPLLRKLCDYKNSANNRNITWNLTDDEAKAYFQNKCHYCNKLGGYNGIDRIDSDKDYSKDNCVSCCKFCNIMKYTYNINKFLQMITYLLSVNLKIDKKINTKYKKHFICSQNANYSKFIYEAKLRKLSCEISKQTFLDVIQQNCHYCQNSFEKGCRGIDRINSKIGYIYGNIVPCCYSCNVMKNILSADEFFHHLLKIYKHSILKEVDNEDNFVTIQDKIKYLCKNVKSLPHEKFFKDDSFYKELIYNSISFDEVSNIKIKLEFVENDKQIDIWNYYRKNVSSLKKNIGAKLIGRQIYILVKDLTTNKYLGIISLCSDAYSYEKREEYIQWSNEEKTLKLKYIMNMSTCVPLQPFGFNFTGGKLLTMLAFSKEVQDYYYNKYNEPLLGITTTALYGKSIQYDKLKELTFIGYTKGNSVKDIPPEVTKICNDYLKFEYGYNYKLAKKFIILQSAFDKLGISKEDILSSNPKGIYFGFTSDKSKDFLRGKSKEIPVLHNDTKIQSCDSIFTKWLQKYAKNRFISLTNKNNLKLVYSVDDY